MTSTCRITLGAIGAALIAVVFLHPAGTSADQADHQPPAAACQVIQITDDTPQYAVDDLTARGWTGRPDDGQEALYSPFCR